MKHIVLLGHDGRNDNLGVGALTVANVDALRAVAARVGQDVHITVLQGASGRPSCVTGPDISEVVVRPLRKPWEVYRILRQADLVVEITGGDSYADIYGSKRIFQTLLTQYMAHLSRRPLVFAPQTLGPFKSPLWRGLAKASMNLAVVLCSRDEKSTAFAREIGLTREVIDASDVALRLAYDAPPPRSGVQSEGAPLRVGLNVSGLLMGGGYTGKNMFNLQTDYAALVRKLITHFTTAVPGCDLHLVGHVIPIERGGVEDDYQTCLSLAKEFPAVTVAPAFTTPSEAKSYIARLDFFMGARMHACIGAFSAGVPVVPMAYSRKFEGLFGTLGYNHTADCTREDTETVFVKICAAFEARADLQVEAKSAMVQGIDRLERYDDALTTVLKG